MGYFRCAFPPDLRCIRHVVINSLASKQLNYRLGISNTVIPNVYDFTHPPQTAEKKNSELKQMIGLTEDDLFILQPTRIVPRKSIERSIEIVSGLNLPNPTLVISHASGDEGNDYFQRINEHAHSLGVNITVIDHLISPRVHRSNASDDLSTITELYQSADMVTYPSTYEGFGNAFLETIYFKKPIIVNRYPVFIADIEPKGFDVLAFDGFVTAKIISQIQALLDDKKRKKEMVDKNYKLAQLYFSYEILEKKLIYLINTLV